MFIAMHISSLELEAAGEAIVKGEEKRNKFPSAVMSLLPLLQTRLCNCAEHCNCSLLPTMLHTRALFVCFVCGAPDISVKIEL